MEALIYNDSPIAEYLEGDGIPFDAKEPHSVIPKSQTFAPRGLPKLRARLRTIRQNATSVVDASNKQFLERFRYVIVASQLLSDEPKPRRQLQQLPPSNPNTFSLRTACITAGLSFFIAWSLHLLRQRSQTRQKSASSWSAIGIYFIVFVCAGLVLLWLARRQYLKFVQEQAASELDHAVSSSHNFDGVATEALRFVQEVEIVSRGYEISHPLPPITRLEDKQSPGHCHELRECLGESLTSSIVRWVNAHNDVQPFVNESDLHRYHDIYEVSMQDYADTVSFANENSVDGRNSIRELLFLLRLHLVARKVFLCDLLALQSGSAWHNLSQWRLVSQLLATNSAVLSEASPQIHHNLVRLEYGTQDEDQLSDDVIPNGESRSDTSTPHKRHTKAQIRRFEAVANTIRSLNAKVHLLREEIHSTNPSDDAAVSMAITGHYDQLGAEIRSVLLEWEKGRNTMYLNVGTESDRRLSRTSSGLRSPASPSPSSLGGLTIVEGGPAEALKLLSGDERSSSDGAGLDEEVFEAVALPRKRMSWAPLSREEKLNKLQEDRRKRATMQEHADNTTNMLRELHMVIKHRPLQRTDTRITSI